MAALNWHQGSIDGSIWENNRLIAVATNETTQEQILLLSQLQAEVEALSASAKSSKTTHQDFWRHIRRLEEISTKIGEV